MNAERSTLAETLKRHRWWFASALALTLGVDYLHSSTFATPAFQPELNALFKFREYVGKAPTLDPSSRIEPPTSPSCSSPFPSH